MATQPVQKKFSTRVNLFDGGLVTKVNPSDLQPNQSPDCQDVMFSTTGYVETNNGYAKLVSAAIATAPIDGLAVHKASAAATEYLLAYCNGNVYRTSGSTWESVSGGTGIVSSGVDVFSKNFQNNVYFSNGNVQGYKYDGAAVYQAGIRATSGTATFVSAACAATTPLSAGTYTYGITGVTSGGQENGFTDIGSFALGTAGYCISISGIPVYPGSAGAATRNLYRTNPGSSTYYLVSAIANNTASAFVDSTVVSTARPSDLGSMPAHKYTVEFLGFVFCAGNSAYPTRLYYCKQGYPEYWPPANYLEVGQDDGYPISGLKVDNGMLYIFKHDGWLSGRVYTLQIQSATPAEWYLSRTNSKYSAHSQKSISGFDNKITFLNKSGIYNLQTNFISDNPQSTSLGTVLVDSIAYPIEPDIFGLNTAYLHKAAAIDYQGNTYYAVPSGNSTANDVIYQYNHSTISLTNTGAGSWTKFSKPAVNCWMIYKGDLYGGDAVDGLVYKMCQTTPRAYNGSAIAGYYWTPYLQGPPEHKDYTKVWRFAWIGIEKVGAWKLEVGYRGDPEEDPTLTTIDLTPGGTLWGTGTWGVSGWGGQALRAYVRVILVGIVSKMIQFRFRTTGANEYFRVFDLKLDYNLRGQRG